MCLQVFTTDNRGLVVWCLWSVQFEWDVLPAGPELKPLQWNQMVLLERLGLLTEVHCHDDPTSRLYRLPLNWHAKVDLLGGKFCPTTAIKPKINILKGTKALHEHIFTYFWKDIFCAYLCVWKFESNGSLQVVKYVVKYGLSKWQKYIVKLLLSVIYIENYTFSNYTV